MSRPSKIEREITALLAASGVTGEIEPGPRHRKIRIAGKLAGILPSGRLSDEGGPAYHNTLAQVRRAIREAKHG